MQSAPKTMERSTRSRLETRPNSCLLLHPSACAFHVKRSYQICETLLHLPKLADTEPEEERNEGKTQNEAGPVERTLTAENAPAEAVDHPHHRIEVVEQVPSCRDDLTAEADWRNIKAELCNERDHISEIPIFYVQRR